MGFRTVKFMCFAAAIVVMTLSFTLILSKDIPMKKINAKLECSFESPDGTSFRYPGTGMKARPRLEGTINCWIAIPKVPAGVTLHGSLKANGKVQESDAVPRPDDSYSVDAEFSSENGDFEVCSPFTVAGELTRAGKSVWKGKLRIDQSCPD